MTNSINFNEMSRDVIYEVFSYLTLPDLPKVFRVCKAWKLLLDQENFWKRHAQEMKIHEITDIPDYIKRQGSKSCIDYYLFTKQSIPNKTDSIFSTLRSMKGVPEFKVCKRDELEKLLSDIFENYFKEKRYKTCSINIQIYFEKKRNVVIEVFLSGKSFVSKQLKHKQIIKKITCYNDVEDALSKYDQPATGNYNDKIYLKNGRILKLNTITQNRMLYPIIFDIILSVANDRQVTTILDIV
jgi:hypothetical protein